MKRGQKQTGFTIVELLIVIVVIGILAAIALVAYGNVQQRARDASRKSDLAQIAKALHRYNIDNNTYTGSGSGCGAGGNGNGWFHMDYDGATTTLKSMEQCLIDGDYVQRQIRDPQTALGCTGVAPTQSCQYYMKYECGGGTYLYANLESMPDSTTDTDAGCQTNLDSQYGMNYFVRVR